MATVTRVSVTVPVAAALGDAASTPPVTEVPVSTTANMVTLPAPADVANRAPSAVTNDEAAGEMMAVGHGPWASVAADGAADPTTEMAIGTADASADTTTMTAHGKKRRRKRNNAARASRKYDRRIAGFTTHSRTWWHPGAGPRPRQGAFGGGFGRVVAWSKLGRVSCFPRRRMVQPFATQRNRFLCKAGGEGWVGGGGETGVELLVFCCVGVC